MHFPSRSIILSLVAVLAFTQACTKKEGGEQNLTKKEEIASPQSLALQGKPFEYCEAHNDCSAFRDYEAKCRLDMNEKDCLQFVGLFEKLAVKKDCRRKFDTDVVTSAWICDEDAEESAFPKLFERSVTTLSKLKYPLAKRFFGSEVFRSTLDGDLAAEHLERSKKIKH